MSFALHLLMEAKRAPLWWPSTKRITESDLQMEEGEIKRVGEKTQKETKMEGERYRVGTNVCCVTGPLQRPWTLSKTQSHTPHQKEAMKIFLCLQKHIYLFHVTVSFIYLFLAVPAPLALPLESCSMTLTSSPSPLFPPLF